MGLQHLSAPDRDACVGGVNPEAAMATIVRRRDERAAGIPLTDGRKTAVILQGGAMRGTLSAGAMIPMEALGFTEGFDAVYGSSAGAINGAYFLGRQAAFGASVYYRDVANRRFINFLRPRRIMDMDFVFGDVVGKRSRVNVEGVCRNSTPLTIVSTDSTNGSELAVTSRDRNVDLLTALKATSAVPILYDRTVEVAGRACLDGSLVSPVPLGRAIADGCTDILIMLTLPKAYRARPPGRWLRGVAERRLRPMSDGLVASFLDRHERVNAVLDQASGNVPIQAPHPVNIVAVYPAPDHGVHAFTTNAPRLKRAAMDMATRVMRLFGGDGYWPTEVIQFGREERHERDGLAGM